MSAREFVLIYLFIYLFHIITKQTNTDKMYRIFLNFAKSFILSCLSKFYNKKTIHHAIFEI